MTRIGDFAAQLVIAEQVVYLCEFNKGPTGYLFIEHSALRVFGCHLLAYGAPRPRTICDGSNRKPARFAVREW